jgi:DHA1 family multidrug resistance protein-like MFS transporter
MKKHPRFFHRPSLAAPESKITAAHSVQAASSVWTLFSLSASVGVAMIGLGIIWPIVPVYAVELGASGFQVGMIIASFNVAKVLTNPLCGKLSDKWGRKSFIVVGLLLYAVNSLLYISATSVTALILVRLFHGLTSVLVIPIAMALTADIAPDYHLGRFMGTLNMAIMLGMGIGPILGGIIRDYFGMEAAFLAMGGLALITCIGVVCFIPRRDHPTSLQHARPVMTITRIFRHRSVQGLFLLRFFTAAGQGSVYTFLPLLAVQIHLSSSQVGVILSTNIFLIAFLQRVFGTAADHLNPKLMIIAGTMITGISVFAMPAAEGFVKILILNVIMGIGNGIAMPAGFFITGKIGRAMGMGSTMGITDSGWSLGMIASPVLSGVIMDTLGLPYIFIVGGILITIGSVLVYFFLKDFHAI